MPIVYSCAACGREHPSRIRASSRGHLAHFAPWLGSVLEVCPDTRGWVPVLGAELVWRDPPAVLTTPGPMS